MVKSVQQKIVDEIVKEWKDKPDVVAINIFGSVAEGRERPDSDVDIEIIIDGKVDWKFENEKRYGLRVDVVLCSKEDLLDIVEKYPYLCYEYIYEKFVYDPQGLMQDVLKRLKTYFDEHPEVVKFWDEKRNKMKKAKAAGKKAENAYRVFDEAEIKFSKEHKVTRSFFRC